MERDYDGIAWDRDGNEYGFNIVTQMYYPKDGGEPLPWDQFKLIESSRLMLAGDKR